MEVLEQKECAYNQCTRVLQIGNQLALECKQAILKMFLFTTWVQSDGYSRSLRDATGPVDVYSRIVHVHVHVNMYTCTMHKYCIIVLTCTCTRRCKISDYQALGFDTAIHSVGCSAKIPAHRPRINTVRKGIMTQQNKIKLSYVHWILYTSFHYNV